MHIVGAMTIAGSDSGGGAGVQADLRAFARRGAFGTTAITAVTAQNPAGVRDVAPVPVATLRHQMDAVLETFDIRAVKTGMLFDAERIRCVAARLARLDKVPVVVDPVMVATSGARLLLDDAVSVLRHDLIPRATVITPNRPEAEVLLRGLHRPPSGTPEGLAAQLVRSVGTAVLLKGGHAAGETAVDVLSDGKQTWTFSAPRLNARTSHGTGCSLSAAIAAGLALGDDLPGAVRWAKAYVHACLAQCRQVGAETWALGAPSKVDVDTIQVRHIT